MSLRAEALPYVVGKIPFCEANNIKGFRVYFYHALSSLFRLLHSREALRLASCFLLSAHSGQYN